MQKKPWGFLIISLLLLMPSLAFSSMVYQDLTFPESVDLSFTLPPTMDTQRGGFCAEHSVAKMMQALCYRKTGKRIDLSEDYMILLHLIKETEGREKYNLEAGKKAGEVTYYDASSIYDILRPIFNGDVKTESQFKVAKGYLYFLGGMIVIAQDFYHIAKLQNYVSAPMEKQISDMVKQRESNVMYPATQFQEDVDYLEEKIKTEQTEFEAKKFDDLKNMSQETRDVVLKYLKLTKFDGQSSGSQEDDKDLIACMQSGVSVYRENYSDLLAVSLLSRGIPFICQGRVTFPSGETGEHATLRIGYRFNSAFDGHIEWQHFDSNYSAPSWGWSGGCSSGMIWAE